MHEQNLRKIESTHRYIMVLPEAGPGKRTACRQFYLGSDSEGRSDILGRVREEKK